VTIWRRVFTRVGAPGIAVAVVAVALLGGAMSGWLESGPVTSSGALAAAPTTSTPVTRTTTSTTVALDATGTLKAQIVDDLGIDLTSQRLDPDLRQRAALAVTATAIAFRHGLITQAWAPDQVATIEADYDRLVLQHATNPTVPSVTDATFVPTQWQTVALTGTVGRAVVVGHFHLHEPGNYAAQGQGGYVDVFDRTWTVAVSFSTGRWRLEGRTPT
jgi:hypothetical protein